jgi:hypothetical protein
MERFYNPEKNFYRNELESVYKYQSEHDKSNNKDARSEKTIFIAIACYRDDEILPTVKSALLNAKNPERLHFGISLIYKDGVDKGFWGEELLTLPNVKVDIKSSSAETVGLGKQRADANAFYDGEDYYFQIDSHMRFDIYWDDLLIRHIEGVKALGETKPVITGYPRGYVSEKEPNAVGFYPYYNPISKEVYFRQVRGHNNVPSLRIGLDPVRFFKKSGFVRHGDREFADFEVIAVSTTVSPAQLFADGSFLKDVPANPKIRFLEEEQYYSILAFMKGYTFYTPRVTGVMHYYTQDSAGNTVSDRPGADEEFPELFREDTYYDGNLEGKELILNLAKTPKAIRSFADYEKFAGVDYTKRELISPVDRIITNDIVQYINFLAETYTYSTTDYVEWFNEPNYHWRKDVDANENRA